MEVVVVGEGAGQLDWVPGVLQDLGEVLGHGGLVGWGRVMNLRVCYGIVWYGKVAYGRVWCGVVWYGRVFFDSIVIL